MIKLKRTALLISALLAIFVSIGFTSTANAGHHHGRHHHGGHHVRHHGWHHGWGYHRGWGWHRAGWHRAGWYGGCGWVPAHRNYWGQWIPGHRRC